MASSACATLGVAAVALAAGAANSYLSRVIFQVDCDASCGSTSFNKPMFVTVVAFAGMAACLLLWWATHCWERRRWRRRPQLDAVSLNAAPKSEPPALTACGLLRWYAPLVAPALLDLMATVLQIAAVLFISAAVNATMRGTLLLLTAASSRMLGIRDGAASGREWLGMTISTVGVAMVGAAAILNTDAATAGGGGGDGSSIGASSAGGSGLTGAASAAVGIALSLSSNVVQAVQVVYETKYLESRRYVPNEVNGVEGTIGVVVGVAALVLFQWSGIPGNDGGKVEDTAQTFCCLRTTPALSWLTAALWFAFFVSTQAHMVLSLTRGSNFRGFILVARAVFIWAIELGVFYGTGGAGSDGAPYGDAWMRFSPLQLAGFVVLAAGGTVHWFAQSRRLATAAAAAVGGKTHAATDAPSSMSAPLLPPAEPA